MPRLDALAGDAERVVTAHPSSTGGHLSLLTGVAAQGHGLYGYAPPRGTWGARDGARTAAELLANERYRCAAILSHDGVGKRTGVTAGFASIDEPESGVRAGEDVAARAERWLEVHGKERFFLWVHLKGGLEPNVPSARSAALFTPEPELEARADALGFELTRFTQGGFPKPLLVRMLFPELDRPQITAQFPVPEVDRARVLGLYCRYEASLRDTDDALGRVLDALARTPAGERVVAVGRVLLESDGECTPESLLVPGAIHAAGLAPRKLPLAVSTRDLLATALRIAGAKSADILVKQGGQDLLAEPVDGALASRPEREHERNPVGPVHVLYEHDWKYEHRPTRTDLLYDLKADPRERENVLDKHAERAAAMLAALKARLAP
jgi:arylsulfatase A-like enzyme